MYQKIRSGGPGGRSCCDFTQQTSLLIPIPIKLHRFRPSLQVLSAIRLDAGRAGQTLEVHWSPRRANAPEPPCENHYFHWPLPLWRHRWASQQQALKVLGPKWDTAWRRAENGGGMDGRRHRMGRNGSQSRRSVEPGIKRFETNYPRQN